MNLKPQDIVVLLKLLVLNRSKWSYNTMGYELGLSPSQVHSAVKRCAQARLLTSSTSQPEPIVSNIKELILHGLKYLCVPKQGEQTRGMPTSWAAAPLKSYFRSNDLPPVWPDPEGTVRGFSFEPIHKSAIQAAKSDPELYELLVLIDAIREGRAREKKIATELLEDKFKALVKKTNAKKQS